MADFGTDINSPLDLDESFSAVSGTAALAQAIARRLETPRGALWYAPDYGTDVRGRLNDTFAPTGLHSLQADIEAEAEKDERVRHASCSVTADTRTATLTVSLSLETATGPFTLVLSVDALTVQVLS